MVLFLEEMKDRTTYKRGAKRKKNLDASSEIVEQDNSCNKKKIGYSSLCQYANAIVNLWSDQHSVYFQIWQVVDSRSK